MVIMMIMMIMMNVEYLIIYWCISSWFMIIGSWYDMMIQKDKDSMVSHDNYHIMELAGSLYDFYWWFTVMLTPIETTSLRK